MGGGNSRLCDPQNLSGRVAVVTGASDGIGYETAKALASMGTRTILACRNEKKTLEVSVAKYYHTRPGLGPSIDIIDTCLQYLWP